MSNGLKYRKRSITNLDFHLSMPKIPYDGLKYPKTAKNTLDGQKTMHFIMTHYTTYFN